MMPVHERGMIVMMLSKTITLPIPLMYRFDVKNPATSKIKPTTRKITPRAMIFG